MAFNQPDRDEAGATWRDVADQLRSRWPKLGALMDETEHDVLAYPRSARIAVRSAL